MARTTLCVVALAVGAAFACASPEPGPTTTASEGSAATDRLTDVRVESGSGESTVTLIGVKDPVYTAFLHSEPRALVLDLASVKIDTPNDLVMVYDGLVENVTVSNYGGSDGQSLTRVEIALSQDAKYEITSTDDGLQAVLTPSDATASADDQGDQNAASSELGTSEATPQDETVADAASDGSDQATDPWSDPDAEKVAVGTDASADGGEATEATEAAPAAPVVSAAPATLLTGVSTTQTDGGVLVHLEANGTVGNLESFTLENPDRLVIDMPGLKSQVRTATTKVGAPQVRQIRVGAHADKVRVVIDGGKAAGGFQERHITPANDGLYLALGSGPELENALAMATNAAPAEAPAPAPEATTDESADTGLAKTDTDEEAAPEAAPEEATAAPAEVAEKPAAPVDADAQVYGIHYDSEDKYERVVILSDKVVDYDLLKPDPETVVVSIRNAKVAPEATGRVIAHARKPISVIATFQQPDVEVPEVRVVVKRAPGLEPKVLRRGSMLFVDFPNTGLVAAPPPAFSTEQEWADAGLGAVPAPGSTAPAAGTGSKDAGTATSQQQAAVTDGGSTLEEPAEKIAQAPQVPSFEQGASAEPGLDGTPPGTAGAAPAAMEPASSAEILQEGGLIDGKEYTGRRISLDFKDVPVADVLRLIAEVSDLNLIAGDEVKGNVTIRLVDVPWDQALDVILLTKGLGFVRVGNVLRIAPADVIKAEEEVRLQERRNKETLEDLAVKLQPVNYAKVDDVSKLVKRLLSPRGTVNVDKRTNTLIIKDIPSVIDEATALVKAIDTETPQVLIEAKIVEAALDFSRELGSIWSAGTNKYADGFNKTGVNTGLGGPDFRFKDNNNVIFGNPITSVPTGVLNMSALVLNEDFNLDVQIQAAESTGDGKVISSPRVLTLDNREASIQQGVSIPFQTFENGDAKLEFIDAVLSLLVTPHVTADKTIIMQMEVTRNAPDDSVPTPTGSPAIARAEAKTETLVKDGQTLVIGGIYTVNESQRESRVPYLHRLPVIGSAFKSRSITDQRKELLIFVTPRIVVASELAGS